MMWALVVCFLIIVALYIIYSRLSVGGYSGGGQKCAKSNIVPKNKFMIYSSDKLYKYNNVDSDCLTLDTPFNIASITKLFVVATLRLMEQSNLIDLNSGWQSASTVRPIGFPDCSIMDLIDHKSGLERHYESKDKQPTKHITATDACKIWENMPGLYISANKGARVYSNIGYQLLGHIIEVTMHDDWINVIKKLILTPLDIDIDGNVMSNTYCQPRRPTYHYSKCSDHEKNEIFKASAAGELCMTINDLIKFCKNIDTLIPSLYTNPIYTLGKNNGIKHTGRIKGSTSSLEYVDGSVIIFVWWLENAIEFDSVH